VAGRLSVDTTFLIDLQRERRANRTRERTSSAERARSESAPGPAHDLLRRDPDVELFLSVVALGENAEGFEDENDPVLRVVRDYHTHLDIDEPTALVYGRITRELRDRGTLIGSNDLWIAATSVRHDVPLATANAVDFRRVPGLEVIAYG